MPVGGDCAAAGFVRPGITRGRPVRAILPDVRPAAAICAGELLWLAPPAAAIYAAWILDRQLGTASPDKSGKRAAAAVWWPYLYPLVAAACAAVIGVKLLGRVLPYHLDFTGEAIIFLELITRQLLLVPHEEPPAGERGHGPRWLAAELEFGNCVKRLRRGLGEGERAGRAENDQPAVGDDQAAAIEAAGTPLGPCRCECPGRQLVVVEAVEMAVQSTEVAK